MIRSNLMILYAFIFALPHTTTIYVYLLASLIKMLGDLYDQHSVLKVLYTQPSLLYIFSSSDLTNQEIMQCLLGCSNKKICGFLVLFSVLFLSFRFSFSPTSFPMNLFPRQKIWASKNEKNSISSNLTYYDSREDNVCWYVCEAMAWPHSLKIIWIFFGGRGVNWFKKRILFVLVNQAYKDVEKNYAVFRYDQFSWFPF